jgi:catechol 2,3-dioxygenase-like lactoylglutathione lyase family enzyme
MLDGAKLVAFVATTDLERSDDFYGDVLGLHHIETTPFANVYDVGGTTLRVTLVQQRIPAPYTVLGWEVADMGATVATLTAGGIAIKRVDGIGQDHSGIWTAPVTESGALRGASGGARIAWFEDPDGNVLSVGQVDP